ncbi:MAG: glutaminyl-tRNA synthetase [Ferruginibacter sp.]|uniref:DUF6370 family protein n=1 Tax=Ferruginibacter sp. TaxID=1940288 RepID=UPI002659467D|nr:DUF6370 family protein [Ferruginibacter sp.]MDB5275636.1 glutaminyl-tRNA synthetase [Ferruginibacter sp.]
MKSCICLLISSLFLLPLLAQHTNSIIGKPDPSKKTMLVETACGECQLGLHGKSCDLAIRINGKAYFVDGAHIDSFGDAHAKDGFCEAVRTAEVQGQITGNRFKATYFKLMPSGSKK